MDRPKELELKIMIFGVLLVILLLAITIIIFLILYQKKLLAQQIRLQYVQHEYQRQLLSSSIEAQEKERIRIGHDLHDEIGSSLSTVKLLVNQIVSQDPSTDDLVHRIRDILSNTIQNVKDVSHNLSPSVLKKFGLVEALQYLVTVFAAASPLHFEFNADDITPLSYSEELALYRIVQELINNAIKHANATHMSIELRQLNGQLILVVTDNGCGFDYKEAGKNGKGIGLKSIEARKEMLQADMHISAGDNTGTRIEIILPLNKQ